MILLLSKRIQIDCFSILPSNFITLKSIHFIFMVITKEITPVYDKRQFSKYHSLIYLSIFPNLYALCTVTQKEMSLRFESEQRPIF